MEANVIVHRPPHKSGNNMKGKKTNTLRTFQPSHISHELIHRFVYVFFSVLFQNLKKMYFNTLLFRTHCNFHLKVLTISDTCVYAANLIYTTIGYARSVCVLCVCVCVIQSVCVFAKLDQFLPVRSH